MCGREYLPTHRRTLPEGSHAQTPTQPLGLGGRSRAVCPVAAMAKAGELTCADTARNLGAPDHSALIFSFGIRSAFTALVIRRDWHAPAR